MRREREGVVLDSVSKLFGGAQVVDRVSFSVSPSTCFGLLGPNGAGKSTTLKMIYGFLKPSAGVVRVDGFDVAAQPREAKRRLGVVPQEDTLDPDLTVLDNLVFHARYSGISRREGLRRAEALLERAELAARRSDSVGLLSSGLRRRLVLARALMNDPTVLVLDEPTRGLDAASRTGYLERVCELKRQGTTVVLATHDREEAEALCDEAILLEGGRVARRGPPAELLLAAEPEEPARRRSEEGPA